MDLPFGVSTFNGTVTAAGASQTTATLLNALTSVVTVATSGAGVQVRSTPAITQIVYNGSTVPVNVWPQVGMAIAPAALNVAISLQPGWSIGIVVASASQAFVVSTSFTLAGLSTTLPSVPGVLWNNGGVMSVS